MDNVFILDYIKGPHMINIEQGINIYHLLNQTLSLGVPGAVVELGCCYGNTACVMRRILDDFGSDKEHHVFDSFEGLPEITEDDSGIDEDFSKVDFKVDEKELVNTFAKFNLKLPFIHKGWFKDTLPYKLPQTICFAHLDGDLYSSIKESLEGIYPRLSKGAIVVIDDYCDPELVQRIQKGINTNEYSRKTGRKCKLKNILPGIKKACDEFFKDKPEKMSMLIAGEERHGYFRKE